ncbi:MULTISPECIES: GNAT family N-acetyltransferase [Marinomonas]|uniref:GNAT family N-acetyltransferase n=1 Tax=Marinomonas TaxID=28253 RepID=UPI0010561CA6|nr:GNAT family N-acetyltransferase [Marinomonas sp. KMM3893]
MAVSVLNASSWSDIQRIQQAAYVESLHEECEVLKSKWQASPDTCFQYRDETGRIVAYLLTHAWGSSAAPKLHDALPEACAGDQLFVHDLAVSPEAAGKGIAKALLSAFFEQASLMGYSRFMLVAVQGSVPFWARYGFQVKEVPVSESYGEGARLMVLSKE